MTERLSNIRENIFMFVKTIYYGSCRCFLVLILLFVEDDIKQHLMLANLVACCSPFDDLPGFCTTKLTYVFGGMDDVLLKSVQKLSCN